MATWPIFQPINLPGNDDKNYLYISQAKSYLVSMTSSTTWTYDISTILWSRHNEDFDWLRSWMSGTVRVLGLSNFWDHALSTFYSYQAKWNSAWHLTTTDMFLLDHIKILKDKILECHKDHARNKGKQFSAKLAVMRMDVIWQGINLHTCYCVMLK